jgi:hypothetical protein
MSSQPDFSGRWRADLPRCTFATPAPRSLDMLIEHIGDSLRQKVVSVAHDGADQLALFTCRTSGAPGASRLNGAPVAGSAWWLDGELVIEVVMPRPDGELRLVDCWRLSDDRLTLTMTHRDDALAGQTVELARVE